MARRLSKYGWRWGVLLCSAPMLAQAAPDSSVAAAIGSLTARAGVVFAGEVTAVRPLAGVVEVEFRIAQSLKGAAGGSYVLREWAGLWASGQRRYWVGERAVIFLHDAGKSGLSSPVDGMEGVLPITPEPSGALTVEVERLRTRVVRPVGAPMGDAAGRLSVAQVAAVVKERGPQPDPGAPAAGPGSRPIARPILNPDPDRLTVPVRTPPVVPQPLPPGDPDWQADLPESARVSGERVVEESPNETR